VTGPRSASGAVYGEFSGAPSREELERFFFLDDADKARVATRRSASSRLGFALQLGTVRFLGVFLNDPTRVPGEVVAARALGRLDITVEHVRAQVARIVASGDEVAPGQIPFTPRAKEVLELALREALMLSHNYIGTEHILLGLIRENEGVATRVLVDLDADAEKIRNEVIRMLSNPGRSYTPAHPQRPLPQALSHAETDEGVSRLMQTVATGIAQHLGRPVDAGDLLVAFASVPEGSSRAPSPRWASMRRHSMPHDGRDRYPEVGEWANPAAVS